MSSFDAAPLPRLGEVFFDVRGDSRSMRLSWYGDTGGRDVTESAPAGKAFLSRVVHDWEAAADPARDAPVRSRQVDYVVARPGSPDHWLMVVFSTLGDGDPDGRFARILVELFDAIMSTFRWTWPDQEPGAAIEGRSQ